MKATISRIIRLTNPQLKRIHYGMFGLIVCACLMLVFKVDYFHLVRMGIHLGTIAIVALYGHKSMKPYSYYIIIGLTLFMISAHVTTYYGRLFELRIGIAYIAYALFARAFIHFKGITYKSKHLVPLLVLACSFFIGLYANFDTSAIMLALYILIFVFMSWQGGNLFSMEPSYGHLVILIFVIVDIVNNLCNGFNLYYFHNRALGIFTQHLHWVSLILLAYSTTLPRKQFAQLLTKK